MSASAGRKDFLTRVTQAVALVLTFGLIFGATHLASDLDGASSTIGALGLLLLGGILLSELCELIGLPHLSGYLLAGIVAGPHVLHLVDHDAVQQLSLVNTLALALIALAGGAELRMASLREGYRSLLWSTLVHSTLGLVAMTAVFVLASRWLPFLSTFSFGAVVGVALLWGVLAISRSPSATLGILAEVRPRGPITQFSLAFVMSSDVVVVLLLSIALGVARPLIDPGATFSFSDLGSLAHEIVGSVALGTTLGLALAAYLRVVGGQLLLLLVALGFGVTAGLKYLHFDPLLTFLIAGFVVQNLSEQGDKLLHGVERAAAVVFVVFFATAGAHLDMSVLRAVWPVALGLAAARVLATWLGHRVAGRLSGDPPVVRRWGWAGLVSQAGLTLGLSAVIERAFPALGGGFGALVIATVAINEMVGPVLFKLTLDRMGESGRANEKEASEAEGEGAAA